ncbi:MAG: DNA-directed RNA polymerase subunit L [Candidatus Thermoplasmatota archaeon]|nr:DNA-directed RNA polymerase subunit L [Arenicellales bacterium]MEC7714063.1 DNA-directed RNA polymerase subunit L [Candidatus Thermoplasmatota archaeon]MED5158838.1 DNA-directed RNA polymerase subunit L [Candidatus Thermoplasmatota archaeon]MEE3231971.1 DNA-directed RNA polymerase subunit L [Candidatus Thermoplasmatota archaeon]MEE3277488.1 DNA-directed RNA polymerase subunit L [Candidatus Thermoplasmatota archaeon]|tara:strand:- start:8892 stop:9149 length:258 start_codon:yes stop_codon:yes gene_type:complete
MSVKVLKNEGRELRLRISGESHTTLQLFRSRLNESKDVEYSNYFQNHPDLDEPELYIRASKGKSAEKVFKSLCSDISKELSKLKL